MPPHNSVLGLYKFFDVFKQAFPDSLFLVAAKEIKCW